MADALFNQVVRLKTTIKDRLDALPVYPHMADIPVQRSVDTYVKQVIILFLISHFLFFKKNMYH